MEITSKKLSDSEIEITKQEAAPAPKVIKYDYDFLINQRAQIVKQANDYVAQRQAEIDEVDGLLAECEKLGITGKTTIEPIKEPVTEPTEEIIP